MKKLIKDGKVAVIYSPEYGGGWSTCNEEHAEELLFNHELAMLIVDGKHHNLTGKEVKKILNLEDEYVYLGALGDLEVEWLPVGTRFRVDEYDGREQIILYCKNAYKVA